MRTFLYEFWLFGIKLASASIFGGYLLFLIIVTHFWYPIDGLYRNDFLFLAAVGFQIVLLAFRLESFRETIVIMIFHIVATFMELVQNVGRNQCLALSWRSIRPPGQRPIVCRFHVQRRWQLHGEGEPDSGLSLYQCSTNMGIVRSCHVDLRKLFYTPFLLRHPQRAVTGICRVLYGRCIIYFRMDKLHRHMPLMLAQFLTAIIIWFAENVATYSRVWVYPNQTGELADGPAQ